MFLAQFMNKSFSYFTLFSLFAIFVKLVLMVQFMHKVCFNNSMMSLSYSKSLSELVFIDNKKGQSFNEKHLM